MPCLAAVGCFKVKPSFGVAPQGKPAGRWQSGSCDDLKATTNRCKAVEWSVRHVGMLHVLLCRRGECQVSAAGDFTTPIAMDLHVDRQPISLSEPLPTPNALQSLHYSILYLCVLSPIDYMALTTEVCRLPGSRDTCSFWCIHPAIYRCRETLRILHVVSHSQLLLDARAS